MGWGWGMDRQTGLREALRLVWAVLSVAILLVLLIPFAVPYSRLAEALPRCARQRRGGQRCSFCGLTRGFYALAAGRPGRAQRHNRLSLPLAGLLLVNELVCVAALARRRRLRLAPVAGQGEPAASGRLP